jgi:hypothetical protein
MGLWLADRLESAILWLMIKWVKIVNRGRRDE